MSQYGSAAAAVKNPPWVRSGQNIAMGVGQTGQMPPSLMANAIPPIANASVLQYPQQQVFQGQMGIQQATMNMSGMAGIPTGSVAPMQASLGTSQMYGAVGAVTYPTRALNSAAFQGTQTSTASSSGSTQSSGNGKAPQRVFTGTITKIQDNFGFVDEDVFFQTSCCVKGSMPQVGDRVLVEAVYNANMPFKWNATRIQVLQVNRENAIQNRNFGNIQQSSGYNSVLAVPPPSENLNMGGSGGQNRFASGGSRFSGGGSGGGGGGGGIDRGGRDRGGRGMGDRGGNRQQRDDGENDRKRRREDRDRDRYPVPREKEEKEKERLKSPPRKRSKSPIRPRRQRRVIPRYSVQVPKVNLDSAEADVMQIRKRYTNMYIPSDFFTANLSWVDTFPLGKPVSLNFPCSFHIMHKDVDPISPNEAVLEPPDMDYLYSAKVMLLNVPGLDEMYSKCLTLAEDRDREGSRSTDDDQYSHPARLIQFLVGLRGKNETMAIGGPWSPSLDGENPQSDPGVLIKTATRNCKALTGIDLSACTQWFRFLEIFYHRAETVHKGKTQPARVETVVLFVPDVWSCLLTRLEWDGLQLSYQKQLSRRLNKDESADEKEEEPDTIIPKREPRRHSELDPKSMKVNELREELEARTLSPKGLKSQLVARLQKVIRTEADEEAAASKKATTSPPKVEKKEEEEKKKKEDEDKKKYDERDRVMLEKRYKLPDSPHIMVHPNRTAKSGKFDCQVMSLSSLLGYRQDDTKEHSFEVSLFAELFNEMLMRDFGFNIYCSIFKVPEKPKEDKEKDHKKDKGSKDKESKEEKDNKDKKDDDGDDDDEMEEEDEEKDKKDKAHDDRRRKMYTADPLLLLSFMYFDTTRCGYIFDKDLEDLIHSLGLALSRAQVKKLLQKVVTRDSLHYRRLTDKMRDDANIGEQELSKEEILRLARGNKILVPTSQALEGPPLKKIKRENEESETLKSGYVTYNGSLVDIGKLMDQLTRSETSRVDIEKALTKLRQEHNKVKDNLQKVEKTNKEISNDLKDVKERLSNANSELCNMDGKARMYHSIISEIHEKVKPLLIKPSVSSHSETKEVDLSSKTKGNEGRKTRGGDLVEVAKEQKENEKEKSKDSIKKEEEESTGKGSGSTKPEESSEPRGEKEDEDSMDVAED